MPKQAYIPYEPLNVLKPVAPDVWIVDGPEIRMRYLGLKLPFPTRMTLVRLPDGGIWVHSPSGNDPALMDAVAQLGPVTDLIAPNSLHYWWLPDWYERFPGARVHVVEGLAKRARRPLPPHKALTASPDIGWGGAIDQIRAPGSLLTEVDFFHRPSRTLILTDLIENFEPKRVRSPVLRRLMQLFGAADPDGKAPYDMQLSFWRHRKDLRRAVTQMLAWKPERILIAHGRWYPDNAEAELRRAFRWVL
ncbi:DUF4336 domain-containing protein [Stakelama sediminis]|uniref:DUF4336 domain-containing protein n=1 Tax=Stakelama sediminis TaxID=463200 RepID=A0A840YY76_9SPHN|nr:DUF4336 domain-containing protein [Stakelama sediminis]MBB5718482.1 hypothetical protein [Stakelama sediminis]